jgi:hypothetical protein
MSFLKVAIGELSRKLRHFSALLQIRFDAVYRAQGGDSISERRRALYGADFSSMIRRDVIVIGGYACSMKPLGCLAGSSPANLQVAVFLMAHCTLPKFLYGILRDCKLGSVMRSIWKGLSQATFLRRASTRCSGPRL